jgi:hypothetical protein
MVSSHTTKAVIGNTGYKKDEPCTGYGIQLRSWPENVFIGRTKASPIFFFETLFSCQCPFNLYMQGLSKTKCVLLTPERLPVIGTVITTSRVRLKYNKNRWN